MASRKLTAFLNFNRVMFYTVNRGNHTQRGHEKPWAVWHTDESIHPGAAALNYHIACYLRTNDAA